MTQPGDDAVDVEDRQPTDHVAPEERDIETPAEDAIEQAAPADPRSLISQPSASFEVNEYDAIEQAAVVELDDDYR